MEGGEALVATHAVARALERLGVAYVVAGSLASSFHGIPRSTHDSDLVVDLRVKDVGPLADLLAGAFYIDRERALEAVTRGASFNVIHLPTMFKVDLFVVGDDPASRRQLARGGRHALLAEASPLPIASAEDTVVQKLRWYRLGNEVSDRQWQDLLGVLRVQRGRLDEEYMRQAARALGVEDLLDEALGQA